MRNKARKPRSDSKNYIELSTKFLSKNPIKSAIILTANPHRGFRNTHSAIMEPLKFKLHLATFIITLSAINTDAYVNFFDINNAVAFHTNLLITKMKAKQQQIANPLLQGNSS